MQMTIQPECETLFLHVYVDNDELDRIAKRLRLTPMKEPAFRDAGITAQLVKRICYKLHNNVTIYVYGDID